MKLSSALVTLLSAGSVSAFSGHQQLAQRTSSTKLDAGIGNNDVIGKACATAAMTAFLWGIPGVVTEQVITHNLPLPVQTSTIANAKDKASATGSRVNKDAESLLRLGLPIKNKEVCLPLLNALQSRKFLIRLLSH